MYTGHKTPAVSAVSWCRHNSNDSNLAYSSVVRQCRWVMRGRLTGGDRNDHDDAEYDDDNKIDGQHYLLETMTLHRHRQTDTQCRRVMRGRLTGGDRNDHDDAEYNDH